MWIGDMFKQKVDGEKLGKFNCTIMQEKNKRRNFKMKKKNFKEQLFAMPTIAGTIASWAIGWHTLEMTGL